MVMRDHRRCVSPGRNDKPADSRRGFGHRAVRYADIRRLCVAAMQ